MRSGIYAIVNKGDGRTYIGGTINFVHRWSVHKCYLNKGTHSSRELQLAWSQQGAAEFEFKIVLICSPDNVRFYEQLCLDAWQDKYNACPRACSRVGTRNSPEHNANISAGRRGTKWTVEARERVSIQRKGRRLSEETKRKLSAAHTGKKRSPEHCRNISLAQTGKVVPREHMEKAWAARKAKGSFPQSAETRQKQSIAAFARYARARAAKAQANG